MLDELIRAQGRHYNYFLPQLNHIGIPIDALLFCGVCRVRVDGEFYAPDPDGEEALIVPVFEEGVLVDLACLLGKDEWFLRTGNGVVLGYDSLDDGWFGNPLVIFRSPLDWLRSGCEGVCVVGAWSIAKQWLPRGERQIAAEDVAHGEELKRRLTIEPDIRIAPKMARAA